MPLSTVTVTPPPGNVPGPLGSRGTKADPASIWSARATVGVIIVTSASWYSVVSSRPSPSSSMSCVLATPSPSLSSRTSTVAVVFPPCPSDTV